MLNSADNQLATKIVCWTTLGVSLIILPGVAYDPINTPKLFFLGIGGFGALIFLAKALNSLQSKLMRASLVTLATFVLVTLVSFIIGKRYEQQFYGVFGRNTGLLAILSLSTLFALAIIVQSHLLTEQLYKTLIFSGTLALIYGLLQVLKMDPVEWSPTGYTRIFGFLGNPNFQSAFLGMFGSALFAFVIFGKADLKLRAFSSFGILGSVFTIMKSESEQGFLVLGSGTILCLLLFTIRANIKPLIILSSGASTGIFVFIFLGILNKGPLSSYLYKDSIQFRGDYWRTAWKIGMENPFFGLGIDRYGENYRLYRDALAATRRGPEVTSNSPHNVFLDYLTNSGFIAFALYILLHFITLTSVVLYLRRTRNFSPEIVGLFAAWIAYVAQSVISVNQLGLAVWGWVLMGALIGLTVGPINEEMKVQKLAKKSNVTNQMYLANPGTLLRVYVSFAIGGVISFLPLYRDIDLVASLKSGDAQRIENQAYSRPLQAFRMFETASILLSNNLNEQSLRISRTAVNSFPNTFELWKLISVTPGATDSEIEMAQRRMKELDPNNPSLK
jgi:hypothetical protein